MALLENLKIAFERVEAEGMVPIHAAEAEIMEFVDHIKQHLTRDPELVFAVLRRVKPVLYLKSKNLALVTRYDDVHFSSDLRAKNESNHRRAEFFSGDAKLSGI